MLVYEVQHGDDVHYFYDTLEGLASYLFDRGVRSDEVDEVVYLSGDLESNDFKWFPWCGVKIRCMEKPPFGSQDPR